AGDFYVQLVVDGAQGSALKEYVDFLDVGKEQEVGFGDVRLKQGQHSLTATADRKSTRLNSSHLGISYAVFCLKKKKNLGRSLSPVRTALLDSVGATEIGAGASVLIVM